MQQYKIKNDVWKQLWDTRNILPGDYIHKQSIVTL